MEGKQTQPHLRLVDNMLSSFIVILTSNEMTVSINSPFGLPSPFKEEMSIKKRKEKELHKKVIGV